MTDRTQPEAVDLADWLEAVGSGQIVKRCAALLREQHARITELESQLAQRFDAADMATAAAQGFRDGVASVSAGSEPVAVVGSDFTLYWAGTGPIAPIVEKHRIKVGSPLYTHPSPSDGMAGWISVDERLPEPDVHVLAHNGEWTSVAAWTSGEYLARRERWQDAHSEFIEMMGPAITHWMPRPPDPTSAEGVAHG